MTKTPSDEQLTLVQRLNRIERPVDAPTLAELLGVSAVTVYKLAKKNVIPNFRVRCPECCPVVARNQRMSAPTSRGEILKMTKQLEMDYGYVSTGPIDEVESDYVVDIESDPDPNWVPSTRVNRTFLTVAARFGAVAARVFKDGDHWSCRASFATETERDAFIAWYSVPLRNTLTN